MFYISIFGVLMSPGISLGVNIEGIDRVTLVQALYNNAKAKGFGTLHYNSKDMSYELAKLLVGDYMDYVGGRVLKIKVPREGEGNELRTAMYNRENGNMAAEDLIESLRKNMGTAIKKPHLNKNGYFEKFSDLLDSDLPYRIFASQGKMGQYFLLVNTRSKLFVGGHGSSGSIIFTDTLDTHSIRLPSGHVSLRITSEGQIALVGAESRYFADPKDRFLTEIDYESMTDKELKLSFSNVIQSLIFESEHFFGKTKRLLSKIKKGGRGSCSSIFKK